MATPGSTEPFGQPRARMTGTASVQKFMSAPPVQVKPGSTDAQQSGRVSTSADPSSFRRLPRLGPAAAIATRRLDVLPNSAVLEIWEGTVISVDLAERVMQVKLSAKTGMILPHTGQIGLQWVTDQDLDLVRPGAVFYLTLFKQTLQGTIYNSQELRFRRRPGWSKQQLDVIKQDAAALAGKIRVREALI